MPRKIIPVCVPDGLLYCHACQTAKPREAFNRDKDKASGLRSLCRQCVSYARAARRRGAEPYPAAAAARTASIDAARAERDAVARANTLRVATIAHAADVRRYAAKSKKAAVPAKAAHDRLVARMNKAKNNALALGDDSARYIHIPTLADYEREMEWAENRASLQAADRTGVCGNR